MIVLIPSFTLVSAAPMLPVVSARKTTSTFGGIVGAVTVNGVATSVVTGVTVGGGAAPPGGAGGAAFVPADKGGGREPPPPAEPTLTSSTFVAPVLPSTEK